MTYINQKTIYNSILDSTEFKYKYLIIVIITILSPCIQDTWNTKYRLQKAVTIKVLFWQLSIYYNTKNIE